jgi:hypothetical protein
METGRRGGRYSQKSKAAVDRKLFLGAIILHFEQEFAWQKGWMASLDGIVKVRAAIKCPGAKSQHPICTLSTGPVGPIRMDSGGVLMESASLECPFAP